MRRARSFALGAAVIASCVLAQARVAPVSVSDIADAITELDVQRARTLLAATHADSAPIALERARLALYVGDCDSAAATLATLDGVKEAGPLEELAKNCAGATAGSIVIQDPARGLWIRLQDSADSALVPELSDVVVRARAAIERDLGVVMPRPLRIDVVRDLFSLSAVTGLPLKAAETTGTVAVARWGRVNIISPRAGTFPWEDTLAHEITHLAITRATRDAAPLWLQEGLAKRQETRWRPPRPFDGEPAPDAIARDALLSGQSVGVDKLGPSIAMLPSADAASIAFAEVSSFMKYWIAQNGKPALELLFADLKGLGGPEFADAAMRTVSGYDLSGWILRWQDHLRRLPPDHGATADAPTPADDLLRSLLADSMAVDAKSRARAVRTGELLFARGAPALASEQFRGALVGEPDDPALRFRLGRSLIASGKKEDAAPLFQSPDHLFSADAGWFALEGRFLRDRGSPLAAAASDFAIALDPYLEDAACYGQFRIPDATGQMRQAPLPTRPEQRGLCEAARKIQEH